MTYYPINEDDARRAKEMNSFSEYREGSATASYRAQVDKAALIAEHQKSTTDPMYHDTIDHLLDIYACKLAEVLNAGYAIETRCPSILVTGGSNFPVRKKEKQNAARDRNMEEYKRVEAILDKIRGTGRGGISSDDPNAILKLKAKLESLEQLQTRMKAANAAIRIKDTSKGDAKLFELGFTTEEIRELRDPDFCGRVGYANYLLSNNNANIRRIRQRIEELEKKASGAAPEGWHFDGGEVKFNIEANRIQIIFDGKPDEDTRSELKSEAFKWAPSQGVWQRQLTDNAIRALKRIKSIQPTAEAQPSTPVPLYPEKE